MSATECSVVLLFRHNFKPMFLVKSSQNTLKSMLQWVKHATSSSCVQLLVSVLKTVHITNARIGFSNKSVNISKV